MRWRMFAVLLLGSSVTWSEAAEPNPDVASSLQQILAVGVKGEGNAVAAQGWQSLLLKSEAALFPTLDAFRGANPVAANWLRSAVDGIVEAETKAGRQLPIPKLISYVENSKNHPDARRIAYELVQSRDKAQAAKLLVGFIDDVNPDLRRDAIAHALDQIKPDQPQQAKVTSLRKLFDSSRDKDQAELIAEQLSKLESKVNLTKHFGYITQWQLIGPFDSPNGIGFQTSYEPEKSVDLAAELSGKKMAKVKWVPAQSDNTYGLIDMNKELGKAMDAAGFAYAVIISPTEQPAEIRAASSNAVQIFLNGKKLFEREEYHHGDPMDGHIGRGQLKKGRNEILIKVLQNNQKERWAQDWAFSARICDSTGGKLELMQEVREGDKAVTVPLGQLKPAEKEGK